MSSKKTESLPEPQLTVLAEYLPKLPPMIARKGVKYFTGGAVSSKRLANDDCLGRGPVVREVIAGSIVYPTVFFLAYLEKLGVKRIVVPQL